MTFGLDILAEVDLARATQILDLSVKVALSEELGLRQGWRRRSDLS
jgi:hypothetical protein